MVDVLTTRLRVNNKQCNTIGFGIGYSKDISGGFYHTTKLDVPTDLSKEILRYCNIIFDKYYENLPIRKVTISLGNITPKLGVQLDLFNTVNEIKENEDINKTIDMIKNKYGKNSLLKASNLLSDSTAIERNKKIGGHNA